MRILFYMLIKLLYMVYVLGMMSLMFTGQKTNSLLKKKLEEKLINIGLNAHIVKFPTVENIAA